MCPRLQIDRISIRGGGQGGGGKIPGARAGLGARNLDKRVGGP